MWITSFIVRGGGSFPLDMLRYDACFPRSQEDVGNIAQLRHREAVEIQLTAYRDTKWAAERACTVGRWESFGWTVIEQRQPYKA